MPKQDAEPLLKQVRVDTELYQMIHRHRATMEMNTGERVTLGVALKDLLKGKKGGKK